MTLRQAAVPEELLFTMIAVIAGAVGLLVGAGAGRNDPLWCLYEPAVAGRTKRSLPCGAPHPPKVSENREV